MKFQDHNIIYLDANVGKWYIVNMAHHWERPYIIKKKSSPNRTLQPARSQVNLIRAMKREHSRKPDEIIPIIEACSLGSRIELFARGIRKEWDMWGNQATDDYEPTWDTYSNHTVACTKKISETNECVDCMNM